MIKLLPLYLNNIRGYKITKKKDTLQVFLQEKSMDNLAFHIIFIIFALRLQFLPENLYHKGKREPTMSNEKKEFEVLFRDMYPKLYYAAVQIVKDEEICRDIISDSFEQLWTRRADIATEKRQAFLYRIIHNKSIDHIRKETAKNKYIEFYNLLYGTNIDTQDTAWEENEKRIQAMYQVIETMTPQTQKILKACYFKGMKYREVAEELGISISAVRKHIVQALKLLRSSIAPPE